MILIDGDVAEERMGEELFMGPPGQRARRSAVLALCVTILHCHEDLPSMHLHWQISLIARHASDQTSTTLGGGAQRCGGALPYGVHCHQEQRQCP